MAISNFLFTSESVSEGHPDKVCDRISDAVVDAFLTGDPGSRVACETLTTTNLIVIAGEVRGPESLVAKSGAVNKAHIEEVARSAVRDIGYEQDGFHWKHAEVQIHLHGQSADIAMGVDAAGNKDEGAGDQGMMFGFACRETEDLMPAPIDFSHKILQSLAEARHSGAEPDLGPDAKSQVTLQYENGKPVRATSVVVSTQHSESVDQDAVREIVRPHVANVLPEGWMPPEDEFYVNPTGRFVIGGPDGDCGLTGRKIIVDTYGGAAPHGGGAFSGKDPTKVDRSAAYAARYLAKNVVGGGAGRALHDPARLCHRRVEAAVGLRQPGRHRPGRRGEAVGGASGAGRPEPARHPRASGSEPAGLRAHRGLRPLRPQARRRRRLLLGEDRHRRQAQGRVLEREVPFRR